MTTAGRAVRTERASSTQEAILVAAERLYAEHGMFAVSTRISLRFARVWHASKALSSSGGSATAWAAGGIGAIATLSGPVLAHAHKPSAAASQSRFPIGRACMSRA